jgi:phage regulator Rha-like protein
MTIDLIVTQSSGELVVDSRLVAEALSITHSSLVRIIKKNKSDFEEFGVVEHLAELTTIGGTGCKWYLLNENQSNLLMMLAMNTPQKLIASKQLLVAFAAAKKIANETIAARKQAYEKTKQEIIVDFMTRLNARAYSVQFFPELYTELERFTGLKACGHKRPMYWAALTNEFIYDRLPKGLSEKLVELRETDPRKKLHQFLTENEGLPALQKHIADLMLLMRTSIDLEDLRTRIANHDFGQYQLKLKPPKDT